MATVVEIHQATYVFLENAPNKIRIQKRQRFWLTSDFFCSEPTLAIDVPLKTKQHFVARGLAQVKTAFCSMRLSI